MEQPPQFDLETELCQLLKERHRGADKPISSKALESIFGVKGTEIRRTVNRLRCKGEPVCSDVDGYFYAAEQSEIDATIAQLTSRIRKIADARDGLQNRETIPRKKEGDTIE